MNNEKIKVGVITMYYGNSNYGACLQAYALPAVINKMGFDCEQISFTFRNQSGTSLKQKIKETIKNYGVTKTVRIINEACRQKIRKEIDIVTGVTSKINMRNQAVANFREQFIPHSSRIYSNQEIGQCDGYDAYVCGSDQIWRIGWGYLNPGFWLSFVHDGGKKISYAASISMNEIPEEECTLVRKALEDYTFISVREYQGKKILDKILQEEYKVEWVVDPTLLLDKSEWEEIASENPYKSERYIFAYLLGDKIKDRQSIMKYAYAHNMKVITIPFLLGEYRSCDKTFGDIQIADVSPQLFLSLIRDAEYVVTDSFHGTVFSLIFHTKFWCLKRSTDSSKGSMNSRIYSLLDLCECDKRVVENKDLISDNNKEKEIDFSKIDEIISSERIRCKELLYQALSKGGNK